MKEVFVPSRMKISLMFMQTHL